MFGSSKEKFNTAYAIFPEERLLLEVYSGVMNFDKLKLFKVNEASNPLFNPDYDRITISNDLIIALLLSELDEYIAFLNSKDIKLSGRRKTLYVANTPNNDVYYSYLKGKQAGLPEDIFVVRNLDQALAVLHKEHLKKQLESLISKMYKNPTKRF